jgi:hypothetical protein
MIRGIAMVVPAPRVYVSIDLSSVLVPVSRATIFQVVGVFGRSSTGIRYAMPPQAEAREASTQPMGRAGWSARSRASSIRS